MRLVAYLSVCLSAYDCPLSYLKNHMFELHKCSVHVSVAAGRYFSDDNAIRLSISDFEDDVVFLQMYCNYSHSHTGVWLEGNNA